MIVDPGPADKDHVRLLSQVGPIAMTLITHHHPDHVGALKRYIPLTGAPVRSKDPQFLNHSVHPLVDGEVIDDAGLRIRVLTTPGHTADSVSLVLDDAVLTGDTILGRGTTILGPHGGALADYLSSLERLIEVGAGKTLLPAHGPELPDTADVARHYRAHRHERLDQVREALRSMGKSAADASPMKVVRQVYRDVDKRLWPAARVSVKAQLEYLQTEESST